MSRPWRRLAVSGSTKWPAGEAWEGVVANEIEDYLLRLPENCILYIRHGNADDGVDNIVHRWAQGYLAALGGLAMGTPGTPVPIRPDVEIVEELVPADWETCNPTCRPTKADGSPHRRPNPGWPDRPRRGSLEDYCPSAGHWRNPEVVGFTYTGPQNRHERKHYHPIPDVAVSLFLAFVYNNSSGTSATLRHAQTVGVPWRAWGAYG